MVSAAPDVDVEGGKVGEFWSLNVLILKCVSCWQPSATSTPPPLSWDRSPLGSIENWQYRLKYTELLYYYIYLSVILFRKYISILFLYLKIYSQSAVSKYLHLRAEDPLKVYSNANTWENFIAKVNNARRWDGFGLPVQYGVWAGFLPLYEVYQPRGPQGGNRTR